MIIRAQLLQDDLAQPFDRFGRHTAICGGKLSLDQHDFLFEIGAPGALRGQPGGKVDVSRRHDALLDEVEHVLDGALDPGAFGAQRLQMCLPLAHGRGTVIKEVGEQLLQAFWPEQPFGHGIDHDRLELFVADARSLTRGLAAT